MRTVMTALALATAFVTAPASAQVAPQQFNPRAPENSQLLPTFNYATVESVLNSIGARHERRGTAARPAIVATFPNNRRAVILFANCEREGAACRALSIQSSWNRPPNVADARLAQEIQQFNQRYAFSKAYVAPNGQPSLQRYLTADYGFVRGNLAVNFLVFANQAERFAVEVLQPLAR